MNRHLVPGIVAASLIAGGGAFAAVWIAGSAATAAPGPAPVAAPAVAAPAAAAPGAPAAPAASGQAATLSQLLAEGTGSTGSHRARSALARLRLLGGQHGQFTFETKKGSRTLAFERGQVQSVTGTTVVIRATDGTVWTWQLTATSVVRDKGSKVAATTLTAGESVFAGGPVKAGARDARLVVIRPASS